MSKKTVIIAVFLCACFVCSGHVWTRLLGANHVTKLWIAISMQRGLNLLEPHAFAEVSITKIEWDNHNYFSTLTPGVHHWLQHLGGMRDLSNTRSHICLQMCEGELVENRLSRNPERALNIPGAVQDLIYACKGNASLNSYVVLSTVVLRLKCSGTVDCIAHPRRGNPLRPLIQKMLLDEAPRQLPA